MTLVVPAVLGGLALLVMAFVSISASRRQRARASEPEYLPTILVHAINDDRCTGCDACVAVCPTNVLDLVDNKSRVLRFQDCIQCEACMWACPTTALVMHKEGTEPPTLQMPELDDHFMTAVPGQYLIGEVAGKPLVKNAANLGRGVIEHMLATGLRPGTGQGLGPGGVDVVIVGSGPGGLSAALSCIHRGLSYVLLEKEQIIASTVSRYPKGKLVMAEPYDTRNLSLLPVFDSSKEELVPLWAELIDRVGVKVNMGEAVEEVVHQPDGTFAIRTTVGQYRAMRVILATGTRGKPRTLGVPGENLPKVVSLLEDPDEFRGRAVLVTGGGDSALEACIALADAGAKVVISYRGRNFARAQPKLKATVEAYESQRRIKIKYQSVITEFDADTVTLQMADGSLKKYPNEAAFVLIGSEPPVKWLSKVGVRFVQRPHSYALPKSDEFVARMVGDARDCPEEASAAAAQVLGRSVPGDRPLEGSGRKWLRSASEIVGPLGSTKRLDRPMPLGEFARRHHTGMGRRDALPAAERTRVLRMLRDEGARLADEESSVELFSVPAGEPSWDDDVGPMFDRSSSPPRLDEPSPKQAVIVGLAQATARGPRGPRTKRRSEAPPPSAAEPSRGGRLDTKDFLDNIIEQDRAAKRASGSPPPASRFHNDPTRIAPKPAAAAPPHLPPPSGPDEPTAMVDFERMIAEEAGGGPGRAESNPFDGEDATLAVDVNRLAEIERSRAESVAHEDPTRQIDLGRNASISDVEFDLD